jgi:hypothetical protein
MRTMRNVLPAISFQLALLVALVGLASCGTQVAGPSSSGNSGPQIDWVNFVRFGGITYVRPYERVGRGLTSSDLGPIYTTVRFKLEGTIHDPAYRARDGDASFLDVGTRVYIVKGYLPTFRLAAYLDGMLQLYEADTNPRARTGSDLLDIAGKVRYIGINSEQDGVTELGTIRNARQVATLVAMILKAAINQRYVSQGGTRYFIAFHLLDGTTVVRSYWLDSGELSRGILLPSTFQTAVEQALQQRKSRP